MTAKSPTLRAHLSEDVAAMFRRDPAARTIPEVVCGYPVSTPFGFIASPTAGGNEVSGSRPGC